MNLNLIYKKMGIFNRKKKSTDDAIKKICLDIQKLKENDNSVSILFLCDTDIKATTLILGSGDRIHSMVERTANQDENFANLLKTVGAKLSIADYKNNMEDNNDKLITLPDGSKATTIGTYDIENMSDQDVDNVINEIIKGINSKNNPEE